MKYCEQCNVKVDNPFCRCPLCHTTLTPVNADAETYPYPDYQGKAQRYNLIRRILVMFSLSTGSICLIINLMTSQSFMWSFIVIACLLYMWLIIATALRRHVTLGYKILTQVFGLAVMIVSVDFIIGHNEWAYDYVLPFLFFSGTLAITILIIVKRVRLREFVLYFLLTALLGFVPLIFLAAGMIRVIWPAAASAVYAGLSMVSLFIFADRTTKIELKKRFHI